MTPTKEQVDELFSSISNAETAAALNKQAKEMFAVAEKSEHFRAVVTQFIASSMQSITVGGFLPKGPALACCVMFLLGQRSVGAEAASYPPVDPEKIDTWMKELDDNWNKEHGEK